MRRKRCALLSLLAIVSCTAIALVPALAGWELTGIWWDPDESPVGIEQEFWASFTPNPDLLPVSYSWRMIKPNNEEVIIGAGSEYVGITWAFPGQRKVRLICNYALDNDGNEPPFDEEITPWLMVHPPDTETVIGGADTPTLVGADNYTIISTEWTYNGEPVVMDASTTAEEKLQYVDPDTGALSNFFDWHSGNVGSTWDFTGNILSDWKNCNPSNMFAFSQAFYGTPVVLLWQQNRLRYWDQDGTWKYVYGPKRLWSRQKCAPPNGAGGLWWKIVEIPGTPPPNF